MNILIIGGTIFLGRHLVPAALARGHTVTLFNRGQHNADLFPEVEKLRGDRNGDLAALEGRRWDAVIDTCGYFPRQVRAMAAALDGRVEHYTFISSISVYADERTPHLDESAAVGTIDDPTVEKIDGQTYGPLKALCEQAAEAAMPGRTLVIRPGLIVGPFDPSDRFTYWPVRVARGGAFAAPAGPDLPVQIIDVRDLAEWIVRLVEARVVGVFNGAGPVQPLTMGQVVEACREAAAAGSGATDASVASSASDMPDASASPPAQPVWIPEPVLIEHKIGAYVEMPLWVPEEALGLSTVAVGRAVATGLTFRPLATTVRDTLEWARTWPADRALRAGLSAEREAVLLGAV